MSDAKEMRRSKVSRSKVYLWIKCAVMCGFAKCLPKIYAGLHVYNMMIQFIIIIRKLRIHKQRSIIHDFTIKIIPTASFRNISLMTVRQGTSTCHAVRGGASRQIRGVPTNPFWVRIRVGLRFG